MISCPLACNELRVAGKIRDPKFFPCPGFHRPIFETSGSLRSFRHRRSLPVAPVASAKADERRRARCSTDSIETSRFVRRNIHKGPSYVASLRRRAPVNFSFSIPSFPCKTLPSPWLVPSRQRRPRIPSRLASSRAFGSTSPIFSILAFSRFDFHHAFRRKAKMRCLARQRDISSAIVEAAVRTWANGYVRSLLAISRASTPAQPTPSGRQYAPPKWLRAVMRFSAPPLSLPIPARRTPAQTTGRHHETARGRPTFPVQRGSQ
jgi:hypothetical protein